MGMLFWHAILGSKYERNLPAPILDRKWDLQCREISITNSVSSSPPYDTVDGWMDGKGLVWELYIATCLDQWKCVDIKLSKESGEHFKVISMKDQMLPKMHLETSGAERKRIDITKPNSEVTPRYRWFKQLLDLGASGRFLSDVHCWVSNEAPEKLPSWHVYLQTRHFFCNFRSILWRQNLDFAISISRAFRGILPTTHLWFLQVS